MTNNSDVSEETTDVPLKIIRTSENSFDVYSADEEFFADVKTFGEDTPYIGENLIWEITDSNFPDERAVVNGLHAYLMDEEVEAERAAREDFEEDENYSLIFNDYS